MPKTIVTDLDPNSNNFLFLSFSMNLTQSRKYFSRIAILFAVITIILAAFLGSRRETARLEQHLDSLVPAGCQYRILNESTFLCFQEESESKVIGYICNQEANAYSGPLEVAVLVDTTGMVLNLVVVSQKETPSYFKKVMKEQFPKKLTGKSYSDPFIAGEDFDAISGATFTSAGIANAVREGSRPKFNAINP